MPVSTVVDDAVQSYGPLTSWPTGAVAVTASDGDVEATPAGVVTELAGAAASAASRFAEVTPGQWLCRGRRSDGVQYTVETFGRNLVHEVAHHLHDVTGVRYSDPDRP
jgi:hypothetical protein